MMRIFPIISTYYLFKRLLGVGSTKDGVSIFMKIM